MDELATMDEYIKFRKSAVHKTGKLKLKIGQVRCAVFASGDERLTGYEFEIIKEGEFRAEATVNGVSKFITMRSWLGIKRYMNGDPREGDISNCFWFDEWGQSFFAGCSFKLTRIKRDAK